MAHDWIQDGSGPGESGKIMYFYTCINCSRSVRSYDSPNPELKVFGPTLSGLKYTCEELVTLQVMET